MQENEYEPEFMIAYSPSHFEVANMMVYPEKKSEYEWAIQRKSKEYGHVVMWNNHFWCPIKAENAAEAFMKFHTNVCGIEAKE